MATEVTFEPYTPCDGMYTLLKSSIVMTHNQSSN